MKIRKANIDDCKFLYELRNLPSVREVSKNMEIIDYDVHVNWFKKSLKNKNRQIYIGIAKEKRIEEKIGMIRFDIDEKIRNEAEVNIALIPEKRGFGYGEKMFNDAIRKLDFEQKIKKIRAEIKRGNSTSIKFFSKLKFKYERTIIEGNQTYLVYSKKFK